MALKCTIWQKIPYICDNNISKGGLLMSTMNEFKEESREVNLNSVEPSDPKQLPSIWYTWHFRRSDSKDEKALRTAKRNSSSANRKNFLFARYEGRFAKNLVAIKII